MQSEIFSFLEFIGTTIVKSDKDEAVLAIDLERHHYQHLDFVHGGVISTIADNTGWFVIQPYLKEGETAMTQELSISYLRPAQGKILRCVGKLVKRGRRSAFVTAEVFCDTKLVAFATSHLALLEKKDYVS